MSVQYNISLADKVSGPATAAAKALSQAAAQAKVLASSMTTLEKAAVKAEALGDTNKLKKLTSQWDLYGDALSKVAPQAAQHSALITAQGNAAKTAANDNKFYADALDGLGGAAVIAAKGILTVAVAIGAVVAAGAYFAIQSAEWKERTSTTFDALGSGGKRTLKLFDDLSNKLPQTRQELAEWARPLEAMGKTQLPELEKALKATASAQALMGKQGADEFLMLTRRIQETVEVGGHLKIADKQLAALAETGVNVNDVAKQMGISAKALAAQLKAGTADAAKFGEALETALINKGKGPLERMGLEVGVLAGKFKDNLSKIFEDVNTSSFMQRLKGLGQLFDENTASGKALKILVTNIFTGLFDAASAVLPYVKLFFLEMEIVALKAYVALMPLWEQLKKIFSGSGTDETATNRVINLAHSIETLLKPAFLAVKIFVAMASAVERVGSAFDRARELAAGFTDGLSHGITGGAANVVSSAESLAHKAVSAVKGVLDSHSPSRVMMDVGANVGVGLASGIESSQDRVRGSALGVGATAAVGVAGGADGGGSSGGGGNSVTIQVGGIHIEGAGRGAEEITEEAIALVFERIALTQGLGAPA